MREQFTISLGEHFRTIDRAARGRLCRDLHESLPDTVINQEFENATQSICILQTWIPNLLQIERSLSKVIARGYRVRILLLNPDSMHAQARNEDLGYVDRNTIRHSIELNLKQLACFHAEVGDAFAVRLYTGTPVPFVTYACDETRFLGFYWRKRRSGQGPQFEICGRSSIMAMEADRHFEDLWEELARGGLHGAVIRAFGCSDCGSRQPHFLTGARDTRVIFASLWHPHRLCAWFRSCAPAAFSAGGFRRASCPIRARR